MKLLLLATLSSSLLAGGVQAQAIVDQDRCCCFGCAPEFNDIQNYCFEELQYDAYCAANPTDCTPQGFAEWCEAQACTERRVLEEKKPEQSERNLQAATLLGTFCPVCVDNGMCGGDPHIQLWSGEYYDYHGECDLVFLNAPEFGKGLGLDLHIRSTIQFDYSFIESAALRIGDDILEVSSYGEYKFNGVRDAEFPLQMAEMYPIAFKQVNKKKSTFKISLDHDTSISISAFKDWVSVNMANATRYSFGNSVGLMGEFQTGKMLARDGTTVLEDPTAFGEEWQVRAEEPWLFDTARYPQYPSRCIPPNPKNTQRRRLGESDVSEEAAQKACEHWGEHQQLCIYDVMARADLEFAEAGAY